MKPAKWGKRRNHIPGRRKFLLSVPFLGCAFASLFSGNKVIRAAPEEYANRDSTRYRLTDHIRKYYERSEL